MTAGFAYQLKCSDCDEAFIGETGCTASMRVKEQAAYMRNGRFDLSDAAKHAIFKNHELEFGKVEVVDFERHAIK